MTDDPQNLDAERLDAEMRRARTLARALVGNEHDGEDVAQQAWVTVLTRPPREGWSLRNWLAGIIKNHARHLGRAECRRIRREVVAAASNDSHAIDDTIEQLDSLRHVLRQARQLDEPYRSTILLRFVAGHDPAEVARRLGVPHATVRTRLKRGIEQLRARMDATVEGGRRAWLIPLATFPFAEAASAAATGVAASTAVTQTETATSTIALLTMKKTTVALFAAVAVLVGTFTVIATTADNHAPPAEAPSSSQAASGAEGVQDLALDGGMSEGRTEVVREVEEPRTLAAGRDAVLRGRVVSDGLGSPLPGATVTITRRMHSEFWLPDTEERDARQPVVTAVTDDEGRFEVAVPTAVPLDVEASASEHATARRDHLFAGDDVELRLTAAAILEGFLTRASDGSPVEGALVLGRDSRRVEQCRARTDIGGRFLFEDLQPGLLTVEITPRDAALPPSKRIELRAGVRARLDVVLEAGVRIHGVVSDPLGRPIAGAEVGLGASFQRSVLTDVHGSYEMVGLGGAKRRDLSGLRARAEGYGNERKNLGEAELAQDTRLDFVLRPARIATGRVVDTDGAPIGGVYVAGVGSKKVEGVSRSDWESAVTGSDGRFELTSLHVLIDHQLLLRKDGYGTRAYDFPADEGDRERVDYGDLVLHPGGRIEGILRAQTGAPIPDHLVKLRGANEDLGRFRPGKEALEKTWVTAVRHSRTDTHGRFHFSDLPGGKLQVTASVLGRPGSKAEETVELPEGGQVENVELSLDLGHPITGVVRTPDGSPAVGVFVQVAGGKGQPRVRATSGADGHFEMFGVTEDMGVVELFSIVASYNWYNPDAHLGASPAVYARAGDTDVVLWLRELVPMTGRVEDAEGQPTAGVQVLAYLNGAARVPAAVLTRATSDQAGAFRLDLPERCLVDLVTGTPKVDDAADASEQAPPEPAVLELVASDAQGVVLRFAK
jgi:RNA polymerase sigma factor (sigma-70 family)